MLNIPAALPDELDRGYLGFHMRLNAYGKEQEYVHALAKHLGVQRLSGRFEASTLELLARASGMDQRAFVRSHTTLPFRRGITYYRHDLPHGDPSATGMMRTAGMRHIRTGVYFCEDCIAADQDFHGRSYWRRQFQLPGQYSCPKHRISLSWVEDQNSLLRSPSTVKSGASQFTEEECEHFRGHQAIRTFLDLTSVLLDSERPIPMTKMLVVLRQRARESGFQVSFRKGRIIVPRKGWVSDEIFRRFPTRWLNEVHPQFQKKRLGVALKSVDAETWSLVAGSSVTAYLLVAAAFFDHADEIVDLVRGVTVQPRGPRRQFPIQMSQPNKSANYDGRRYNLYFKNLGVYNGN